MSEWPRIEDLVRSWVEKAEHDLLNIDNNLANLAAKEVPWDTVGFHAQQCGEKYLKALLVFHRIDFPKVHDLTELYALLPKDLRPPLDPRLLDRLNPYAIEGRYPGVWEPVERDEALRAMEAARAVRLTLPPSCLE